MKYFTTDLNNIDVKTLYSYKDGIWNEAKVGIQKGSIIIKLVEMPVSRQFAMKTSLANGKLTEISVDCLKEQLQCEIDFKKVYKK